VVSLERYFYPQQIVKANPNFKEDEESKTVTHLDIKHGSVEDQANKYVVEIVLSLDKEKSHNEQYDFLLHVFGLFDLEGHSQITPDMLSSLTQSLIGVLRERLSLLTQGGPWRPILLSMQELDPNHVQLEPEGNLKPAP